MLNLKSEKIGTNLQKNRNNKKTKKMKILKKLKIKNKGRENIKNL